ncbi:MAG: FAD-binding oxidoreductase [Pseudomonadota bacterium]|nr:FAD-binding oxidoreductase [Pseudomonadota bacterium]
MKKKRQVTIVGAGITGLSTVFHLTQQGVDDITLIYDPKIAPTTGAGFALGSLFDNFTRLSHAYGHKLARSVYAFAQQSLQALLTFCAQQKLPVATGKHWRLVVSDSEMIEARKAATQMQAAGFACQLLPPPSFMSKQVQAIQDDGIGAALLDEHLLLTKLHSLHQAEVMHQRVIRVENASNACVVHTADGDCIRSEMLVLACHQHIGGLLPNLHEVIIPYADQWGSYQVTANPLRCGDFFTAKHGLEWGLAVAPDQIRLGGARYLLPLAGIGMRESRVNMRVATHLGNRFLGLIPAFKSCKHQQSMASCGVRPCDELPLISPMYGNERILLATGYMGAGLAMGFMAGKCLATIIQHGKCSFLPAALAVKRQRSV